MSLEYAIPLKPEERAFSEEVRAFIAEKLRPEWRGVGELWSRFDMEALSGWTRELISKGWATPTWPEEYGGHPLSVMQRYILAAETAWARAPLIPHVNLHMVAPLIAEFGSDWQKQTFLPRILSCEDFWAQGFSEPGAGSDLASLRTRADRRRDSYVVNGQKMWTTNAHQATELFCLVRTDHTASRPQAGISMLLIPLNSPGITVRPIRTIDGFHHVNEVFLDDVVVPVIRLLGEENEGWRYAKWLLKRERESIAEVQPTRVIMEDVVAVAREAGRIADPVCAHRLLNLELQIDALEMLELRVLDAAMRKVELGYEASLLKVLGSTLRQDVLQLGREALGPLAEIMPATHAPAASCGRGSTMLRDALLYRAASIYSGSNEVQRNVVAKALFDVQEGLE